MAGIRPGLNVLLKGAVCDMSLYIPQWQGSRWAETRVSDCSFNVCEVSYVRSSELNMVTQATCLPGWLHARVPPFMISLLPILCGENSARGGFSCLTRLFVRQHDI